MSPNQKRAKNQKERLLHWGLKTPPESICEPDFAIFKTTTYMQNYGSMQSANLDD